MTEMTIAVEGLTKRYGGRTVVDHVSLNVKQGEIMGFLGPNGSGKTTTIRMICGLITPDSGSGRVLGFDVLKQSREIKLRSGYMTQRFSFYEDLTIAENLQFVARLYDMDPKGPVDEMLESLGLAQRASQLAGTLSGGWKQRLALAACILHKPQLLLLDEPTAGVDPKARREFWDEIHRLAANGITVLVSTHYMDEAERCHRIAYISHGKLITEGTVKDVVEKAGLHTFLIEGPDFMSHRAGLLALPGVDQVAPFGVTLHVVGANRALLEKSLIRYARTHRLKLSPGETSLEDIFIQFMGGTEA